MTLQKNTKKCEKKSVFLSDGKHTDGDHCDALSRRGHGERLALSTVLMPIS